MFPGAINYDTTKVTVELRELVENGVDIWGFEYPVPRATIEYNGKTCTVDFDKETLQQKVIDHYYFRQIGQETVGRFLHYFRAKMREIMPYYVQVYEFDAKFRNIEDPLESYNLLETFDQMVQGSGTFTGSHSTETTGSATSGGSAERSANMSGEKVVKVSDTPQGSISNLDNYLTQATVENDSQITGETSEHSESATNTDEMTGTSNQSTEDERGTQYTLSRRGNIGVQPLGGEVLNIRSAFINIDQQIIEELADLFLKVY